jgi:hypothetical protein
MNVVCEFSVEKARVPGSLDWPSTSAEAARAFHVLMEAYPALTK